MTKSTLPNSIQKAVEELYTEHGPVLNKILSYSESKMTRDIEAHYAASLSSESQVIDKLKNIGADIENKQYDANVKYPSLFTLEDTKLLEALTPHRETLYKDVRDYQKSHNPLIKLEEKYLYQYIAKEKEVIDTERNTRLDGHSVFQFADQTLDSSLRSQTNFAGKEGYEKFQFINKLRETVSFDTGHKLFTRDKGSIKGLDNIVGALEHRLKQKLKGDRHNIVEKLALGDLFDDRFYKAKIDTISLDPNEIDFLADSAVDYMKNKISSRDIGDNIATMIRDRAHFNKPPSFTKDFNSRIGQTPITRMEDVNRKVLSELKADSPEIQPTTRGFNTEKILGEHGSKIAIAGLGLSIAGGVIHEQAKRDSLDLTFAQTEEKRQAAKSKVNKKTLFATVTSVVGTLLLFDALIYKGKHTMDAMNLFSANSIDRTR